MILPESETETVQWFTISQNLVQSVPYNGDYVLLAGQNDDGTTWGCEGFFCPEDVKWITSDGMLEWDEPIWWMPWPKLPKPIKLHYETD